MGTLRRAACAALLLAAAPGPAPLTAGPDGFAVEIYLHRAAVVGRSWTLGEIAALRGQGPLERLAALEMGPAPEEPTLLPLREVKSRLGDRLPERSVLIGGRVALLPETAASSAAERWFLQELLLHVDTLEPDPEGRLELDLYPLSPAILMAATELTDPDGSPRGTVSFRPLQAERLQGHLAGQVEVSYNLAAQGGRSVQRGSLSFQVRQFLPVATAARPLHAGETLTADSVRYEEREISRRWGGFLLPGEPLARTTLSGPVAQGQVIPLSRVERAPAVRAGQAVAIVFERPGLRITTGGRAYGTAALGETVEVRPDGTRKRFSGTAVGPGEVRVENP